MKRNTLYLIISIAFIVISFAARAGAQGNTWATKTPVPTDRWNHGIEVVNDIVYVIGGWQGYCGVRSVVEAYNPATDAWTTKASMPTARGFITLGAINGIIYVAGGQTGCGVNTKAVEAYNPATNTWTTKAPMTYYRANAASGVINGILYVVGGNDGSSFQSTLLAYNPATDTWTQKASMPDVRVNHAASVVDGILYVVGGFNNSSQLISEVYAYNPATDTWSVKSSNAFTPRSYLSAGTLNGKVVAVGGSSSSASYTSIIEAYDPSTSSWSAYASMPTARQSLAVGVANGILYVVGGWAGSYYPALNINEAYTPDIAQDTLTQGLVAHYPFNGNANDESGNGNNGTVNGATLTTDRFGNASSAYYFDGVNDIITVNDSGALRLSTFSIAAWIKHDVSETTGHMIILKGRAGIDSQGDNINYMLSFDKNYLITAGFEETNGTNHGINSDPVDKQWHFLVGTYDGTQIKIWVDGILKGSYITNATPETNTHSLVFGNNTYSPGDIYKGILDDVRIYNRALSASEVAQLYTEGSPTSYTLTVSKSGAGTGMMTSSPSGIDCGATCSTSYSSGTSVTLTATAASGSAFAGWSGGCSATTGTTCTVTMSSAQTVTATFNTALGFCTNSVGSRTTVKITDRSGSLSTSGGAITVAAWDANGNALPESTSATPLKIYSNATTSMAGTSLAARFPMGSPMTYKFTIDSSKLVIANVKNTEDGSLNFPIVFTSGLTNFATNAVGALSTVKITDVSGSIAAAGAAITVTAWDADGNAIPESTSAALLKLYNRGTTTITGSALAARFPAGIPMTYEFVIGSSKYVATNVKSSSDGTMNVPVVYTSGTTNFVTNSISSRNTVKITDVSGSIGTSGVYITVTAWDANGTALTESSSAAPLKLYNRGTTTITGATLAARFPSGVPAAYEFAVGSSKYIITNVYNSTDGSADIPSVFTSGTTDFVTNSVGSGDTIKVTDLSGSVCSTGAPITITAWDANGTALAESGSTACLRLLNNGTTSIKGSELSARFPGGTPAAYSFSVGSSSYIVTSVKSTSGGALNIPNVVYTGAGTASCSTCTSYCTLTITKSGTGSGTVTSNIGTITWSGNTGTLSYTCGTSVMLTATASSGSTFAGWSGVCSGTGVCTATVNSSQSVTATFSSSSSNYVLSITKAGTGSGTVTSTPSGINCGSTCSASISNGTSVMLTATADSGSTFAGWSGACSGTGTCTVTMNSAQTVYATFSTSSPSNYILSITKSGTGSGTVTSTLSEINCGSTCSASFASGTSVTLTATSATGSTFAGWSGGACSGTGTCTVTMSSAQSVTATFTAGTGYTLTVTISGAGRVTGTSSFLCETSTSTTCSQSYASGASVTLTATPTTPYIFSGWSGGGCYGTGTCTVNIMNSVNSVTAMFYYDPGGG